MKLSGCSLTDSTRPSTMALSLTHRSSLDPKTQKNGPVFAAKQQRRCESSSVASKVECGWDKPGEDFCCPPGVRSRIVECCRGDPQPSGGELPAARTRRVLRPSTH